MNYEQLYQYAKELQKLKKGWHDQDFTMLCNILKQNAKENGVDPIDWPCICLVAAAINNDQLDSLKNYMDSLERYHMDILPPYYKKDTHGQQLLIVVDMINGFVKNGAMADPYIGHIISANIKLLEHFKEEHQSICFIKDSHTEKCREFDKYPVHCIEDTQESEIIDELKPFTQGTSIYKKNSTCAMFAPNFMEDINQMKSLREIIITGCCTDICVMNLALALTNYFDQINKKIKITIPMDAVETYGGPNHEREEYNEMAFRIMKQAGIQLIKKQGGR